MCIFGARWPMIHLLANRQVNAKFQFHVNEFVTLIQWNVRAFIQQPIAFRNWILSFTNLTLYHITCGVPYMFCAVLFQFLMIFWVWFFPHWKINNIKFGIAIDVFARHLTIFDTVRSSLICTLKCQKNYFHLNTFQEYTLCSKAHTNLIKGTTQKANNDKKMKPTYRKEKRKQKNINEGKKNRLHFLCEFEQHNRNCCVRLCVCVSMKYIAKRRQESYVLAFFRSSFSSMSSFPMANTLEYNKNLSETRKPTKKWH